MNNGYNPEQFDSEETVGDINQLISRGSGIVNSGRNFVGGARSAFHAADPLGKRNKNDEKDVAAINNRQKNNDGVNRNPRNKDDESDDKEKKSSDENKTQSTTENKSISEDKNKLDDSRKVENNNDDKSKINDKIDKSKKDDLNSKKVNSEDNKLKNKNDKKKNLKQKKKDKAELELKKKKRKMKIILVVLKIVGIIAFPVIIIVLIVLVITAVIKWAEDHLGFFADLIIPENLKFDVGNYHSDSSYIGKYGSSATFIVGGKEYSGQIKVRLYKNDSFELVYSDDTLVDFDKYILGVAYQEVGGGTDSISEQVFKTQAIAARSYALTRGIGMPKVLKITEENGYIVINIRQTTSDQAYCDPDEGYKSSGMYSNCSEGHPRLEQDSPLRKWAKEVEGLVLVNASGEVVNTPYTSVEQNKWRRMAESGMKYDEIIIKHYDSANNGYTIKKIGGSSDVENWKQCSEGWRNDIIYTDTMCASGCAITSVAIQVARSGVSTNVSGEFNPGTFLKGLKRNGMFSGSNSIGWAGVSKVAPSFKIVSGTTGLESLNGTKEEKMKSIKNKISNNEYIVLGVRYSAGGSIGHYVAVNYVGSDEIYTYDPNSKKGGNLFVDYPDMKENGVSFQIIRYVVEE